MANIQSVSFRRVHLEQVFTALDEINRARFDGHFKIEKHSGGCTISDPTMGRMTFWLEKRTLSWKHRGGGIDWWVMQVFASRMIRAIDPTRKIKDEGIEERLSPEFDTLYPTPDEWFAPWQPDPTFAQQAIARVLGSAHRKKFPAVFWDRSR